MHTTLQHIDLSRFHAGAWEREKLRRWSPKLQLWQRRLTLANLVQS